MPDSIQRVAQRTGTDCLRCCIAMVTGIPYEAVPDFTETKPQEAWPEACDIWLSTYGMGLLMFGSVRPAYVPPWLPLIAQGPSPVLDTIDHCTVLVATEEIDPHPCGEGLRYVKHFYAIATKPLARHIDNLKSKEQHEAGVFTGRN